MNPDQERLRELLDIQSLKRRLAEAAADYQFWSKLLAIAEDVHNPAVEHALRPESEVRHDA
jgi:hypothetical protein